MDKEKESFTNEYQEVMEFICQMQEAAHMQLDTMISQKKELEYKKCQQEHFIEAQEKSKIPNIAMFSPLFSDDINGDAANKNELQDIISELEDLEEQQEKQHKICESFEQLKNFISDAEVRIQKAAAEAKKIAHTTNSDNSTNYSIKLLKSQEMDRNRISRELHDSTVQSLTGFGHKLEYCSRLIDKDPVRVKLELQSMIDLNKEVINGMRDIIYDLRPMSLNNIGFIPSVEAYCQYLRRSNDFDVVLKVSGKEQKMSSITSVTLFRILREAGNNAIKHSKAKKIHIRISFMEQMIKLEFDDDGVGFDFDMVEELLKEDFQHSFGLSTMHERAKLLSGSFSIKTKPGCGTKIQVSVPLNEDVREEFYE